MLIILSKRASSAQIIKHYADLFLKSSALHQLFRYEPDRSAYSQSLHQAAYLPSLELMRRPSKLVRPVLCIIVGKIHNLKEQETMRAAALCQLIHSGTLIHDDIEDSSQTRRQQKAIHLKYGTPIALNSACYLFFQSFRRFIKLAPIHLRHQLTDIYLQEMSCVHQGQAVDIFWQQNIAKKIHPTVQDYFRVISSKTSVLMRLGLRMVAALGQLPKSSKEAYSQFANALGLSFQITDDLINLTSNQYSKSKGYLGTDISQGKFSFMVIDSLSKSPQAARLLDILGMRTKDPELISQAIKIMRQAGSLSLAEQTSRKKMQQFWSKWGPTFPRCREAEDLKAVAEFCCQRKI